MGACGGGWGVGVGEEGCWDVVGGCWGAGRHSISATMVKGNLCKECKETRTGHGEGVGPRKGDERGGVVREDGREGCCCGGQGCVGDLWRGRQAQHPHCNHHCMPQLGVVLHQGPCPVWISLCHLLRHMARSERQWYGMVCGMEYGVVCCMVCAVVCGWLLRGGVCAGKALSANCTCIDRRNICNCSFGRRWMWSTSGSPETHTTGLVSTAQLSTAHTAQDSTLQQHNTAQYTQHSIVQHSTAQHSTLQQSTTTQQQPKGKGGVTGLGGGRGSGLCACTPHVMHNTW